MIRHPFQRDTVKICNGQWTEELSVQVHKITQCPVRELFLNDNQRVTMVKEIAHIHFTALTQLVLGGNRIESVEGLARVRMTHIKDMFLWYNNITSVRVIRKAAWPGLSWFAIDNNYCGDAKNLVHGCFPQIQTFLVYTTWGDKNQLTEECFPAKIQAASLKYLRIRGNKFCFGRDLKRVLQQRWLHVDME